MGIPLRFRLGQKSTSCSTKAQLPCRRYDGPFASTHIFDGDIDYKSSRHLILPSMQAIIHARASRALNRGRSTPSSASASSSTSSRRAVSGMKNPMPLFLPALTRSNGRRSSGSRRRMTSGQLDSVSPKTRLSREPSLSSHHDCSHTRSPTPDLMYKDTMDQYRSCSSTTCLERNSFYEDRSSQCSSLTCDLDPIISASTPSRIGEDRLEFEQEISNVPRSALQSPERSRASDLSFKCKGIPDLWNANELPNNPIFCSSAEWLSSSLRQHCAEKMIYSRRSGNRSRIDIESWINDNTMLSFYDTSDEESLACATALTSVKAQVVDVDAKSSNPLGLEIRIPPRSSSLAGTRQRTSDPEDGFAIRPQSTPPSSDCSASGSDHRMRNPRHCRPATPHSTLLGMAGGPTERGRSDHVPSSRLDEAPCSESLRPYATEAVVSTLDQCWSDKLSEIDEGILIAMRSHLRGVDRRTESIFAMQPTWPNVPYVYTPPYSQPSEITSHHQHRLQNLSSTTFSVAQPLPQQDVSSPNHPRPCPQFVQTAESILPPDLSPLHRILPFSTPDLRLELYHALLTHKYLFSLVSCRPTSSSTASLDVSHIWNRQASLYSPDIGMKSVCEYQEIPSKAASRLGLPPGTKLPLDRSRESVLFNGVDMEKLQARVMQTIKSLLKEAQGGAEMSSTVWNRQIEDILIRALVELALITSP